MNIIDTFRLVVQCKQDQAAGETAMCLWWNEPAGPQCCAVCIVHSLFCGCQGPTEARRRPHKGNICPICPSKLANWGLNFPIALLCVCYMELKEDYMLWTGREAACEELTCIVYLFHRSLTWAKNSSCGNKFRVFMIMKPKVGVNNSLAAFPKLLFCFLTKHLKFQEDCWRQKDISFRPCSLANMLF